LKQEVSQQTLRLVRSELLEEEHLNWKAAAGLTGQGSTRVRRNMIFDIIRTSAPELTGEHAKEFKDAIKGIIESSVEKCR